MSEPDAALKEWPLFCICGLALKPTKQCKDCPLRLRREKSNTRAPAKEE